MQCNAVQWEGNIALRCSVAVLFARRRRLLLLLLLLQAGGTHWSKSRSQKASVITSRSWVIYMD